jgi:hypothetical protein
VDSGASMVTSGSPDLPDAQSFRGARRSGVYVCMFIWVGVRAYYERLHCIV